MSKFLIVQQAGLGVGDRPRGFAPYKVSVIHVDSETPKRYYGYLVKAEGLYFEFNTILKGGSARYIETDHPDIIRIVEDEQEAIAWALKWKQKANAIVDREFAKAEPIMDQITSLQTSVQALKHGVLAGVYELSRERNEPPTA